MGLIKMREEVIARHLGSGEKRKAFIDYEASTLTDENGNILNHRSWTYEEIESNDFSDGFKASLLFVLIIIGIGILLIASGATK